MDNKEEVDKDKPKQADDEPVEESAGAKVSNMPSGEFMLHVLIETGKGISLQGEDKTDPLVKVSLCNKEKATSAKPGTLQTTQVIWNEHLFVETGNQTKANIEEAYILFQVLNRGFFLDDMIGSFQIQASTIYKMAKHTVHNQLIQFTNPNSEDKGKITACITVSINLQGPGDEALQLKMGTDPEATKRKPWLPSSVKKNYKQLNFKWIKAESIPMLDFESTFDLNGKFGGDPYIKLEHSKNILKTKVISVTMEKQNEYMTLDPFDINQQMLIPIEFPVAKDKLTFDLWEYDKGIIIDADRLICTFNQSISEIIKDDSSKEPLDHNGQIKLKSIVKWIHLYGSNNFKEYKPLFEIAGFINKHALIQNTIQEAASYYKGRILCEYSIIDCKNPEMKVSQAKNLNKEKIKKLQELFHYQIYFDINNAICLPETNDYKIRIQIGEYHKDTRDAKQGIEQNMKFYNRWGERIVFSFQSVARFVDELPDVFIYLLDKDYNPICFWKDKCSNYTDSTRKQFRWAQFTPDLAIDKVKLAYNAGIFSFKLYIHDTKKSGQFDLKSSPAWSREQPKRLSSYKMRAYIYQGESLPIMDPSGLSDPYIKVYSAQPDEQDLKTQVAEQTCNPIYYTTIDFNLEFNDTNDACPIILNCFDVDQPSMFGFGGNNIQDKFMGRSIIFMDKLNDLADDDHIPDPERFPVVQTLKDLDNFDKNSGPIILASFAKIANEDDYYFLPDVPYIKIENQIKEADKQESTIKKDDEENIKDNQIDQEKEKLKSSNLWNMIAVSSLNQKKTLDLEQGKTEKEQETKAQKVSLTEIMKIEGISIQMPDLCFDQMQIDINVLGLRDLLSTGLLPVRKAFVKFSVKSLLPPSKAKAVQDVFTEPGEGGIDPNIRTVLKIGIRIPSLASYCPRMSCQVFDKLYFDGMNQPILGSFCLNIGKIMADDQAHHKMIVSQIQEFNKNLSETIALKKGERSNQTVLEILHDIIQVDKIKKHISWKKIAILNTNDHQSQLQSDAESSSTQEQDLEKLSPEERKLYDIDQKIKHERRIAKQKFIDDKRIKEEQEEEARRIAEKELSQRKDGTSNIIMPVYKLDNRLLVDIEVDIPNKDMFLPVGYNKESQSDVKHYRRYYTKELEKVEEIMPQPPFMSENIYRQNTPSNTFGFGDEESSSPKTIVVGRFKGLIQVYNEECKKQNDIEILGYMTKLKKLTQEVYETQLAKPFEFDWNKLDEKKNYEYFMNLENLIIECGIKELKIDEFIQNCKFQSSIMDRLNQVVKGKVFFYILDGFNFAKKGLFGDSDPFLIITCGRQIKNEREFYQIDEPNPKFYKCFDFFIDFPGAPVVSIEAFDKDDFFGDSLIGQTKIDLDDRFYNKDWTSVEDKPIEFRNLMHPSTTLSQGAIKLWVEIFPEENESYSCLAQDITPEPVQTYEMRFIIWKTKELITTDFEEMCDPYFRSYLTTKEEHFTDTHWRCQTGIASYNWRNLIKIRSQEQSYLLNIQCYDKDIFSSDEIIGECSLDLAPIFSDSILTEKLQVFTQVYWKTWMKDQLEKTGNTDTNLLEFDSKEDLEELFWLPLRVKNNKETVEGENQGDGMSIQGYVQCSLRIYPTVQAEKQPQGVGRDEPNNDPNLPAPEGRLELSLNPIKMFNQLVSAKLRRQICIALCVIIYISLCVFICPFIPMLAIQGVGLIMQMVKK